MEKHPFSSKIHVEALASRWKTKEDLPRSVKRPSVLIPYSPYLSVCGVFTYTWGMFDVNVKTYVQDQSMCGPFLYCARVRVKTACILHMSIVMCSLPLGHLSDNHQLISVNG